MPITEDVRGLFEGSIHGGMLATLADAASASCLDGVYDFNTFPRDDRYSRPLLPAAKGGPLVAEANWCTAAAAVEYGLLVVDAEGRVLIRTTATFMLVPTRPA